MQYGYEGRAFRKLVLLVPSPRSLGVSTTTYPGRRRICPNTTGRRQTDRAQVIVAPVLVDDILSVIRFNLMFSDGFWMMDNVVKPFFGSHFHDFDSSVTFFLGRIGGQARHVRRNSPDSKIQDVRFRFPSFMKRCCSSVRKLFPCAYSCDKLGRHAFLELLHRCLVLRARRPHASSSG